MMFRLLADAVAFIHAAFVLFVIAGGLIVMRWHRAAWLHLPAALWGASIEFGGWICPLTPLENLLRARAGQAGYGGGFVEHYVLRALYPGGLTPEIRWVLGTLVVVVNGLAYALIWRSNRHVRGRRSST
ncbi:MAG: DUF2784 domain-containing protein [Gemmatimonadaceae bacterium]